MKETYYTYNNEALSSCIFLSILNNTDKIDIARSCLILPFLLDNRTVNSFLKNKFNSIDELIDNKPKVFVSFNKRYLTLLPITINSLNILNSSGLINISKEISNSTNINFKENNLGERFDKINKVIPSLLILLNNYSTKELYKKLNIQL